MQHCGLQGIPEVMKGRRQDDQRYLIAEAFTCSLQEGGEKAEDLFPKKN